VNFSQYRECIGNRTLVVFLLAIYNGLSNIAPESQGSKHAAQKMEKRLHS